jgi:hypothetical protein
VLINLLEPVGNVVESSLISAIVDQDNAHGSLVVSLGDCAESLLASCVPHLQLDPLLIDVNFLDFKVNAYDLCEQN